MLNAQTIQEYTNNLDCSFITNVNYKGSENIKDYLGDKKFLFFREKNFVFVDWDDDKELELYKRSGKLKKTELEKCESFPIISETPGGLKVRFYKKEEKGNKVVICGEGKSFFGKNKKYGIIFQEQKEKKLNKIKRKIEMPNKDLLCGDILVPNKNIRNLIPYKLRIGIAKDERVIITEEDLNEIKEKLIETTPIIQCYDYNIEIIQGDVYKEILDRNEINLNKNNKADLIIYIKDIFGPTAYLGKKNYKDGTEFGVIEYAYKTTNSKISTRVIIHEIGHYFGFRDQYCYQKNSLNPIMDFNEAGCQPTNLEYCNSLAMMYNADKNGFCLGNFGIYGGRTVMGASKSSPIQFDINEWNHLKNNEIMCTYKECIPRKCRFIDVGLKFDGCDRMIDCGEGTLQTILKGVKQTMLLESKIDEKDKDSIICIEGFC